MRKNYEGIGEEKVLQALCEMEKLAEKKANIYSRLLIDTTLAKEMETLAQQHQRRAVALETLLYGKPPKMKNGHTMSEGNEK